jgi:hypothetical protein
MPSITRMRICSAWHSMRRSLDDDARKTHRARSASTGRRLLTSLAFVSLFFAGAALSAGAGDTVAGMLTGSTETIDRCAVETTTGESATATEERTTAELEAGEPRDEGCEEQPTKAPEDRPAEEPAEAPPVQTDPGAPAPPPPAAPLPPAAAPPAAPAAPKISSSGGSAPLPPGADLEVETQDGGVATVWLHRVLPDPTPPAKRLSPAFARRLRLISARAGVDWALVLGVLRAQGADGRVPARAEVLRTLAAELAAMNASERPWRAVHSVVEAGTSPAQAIALWRYNRAVRLRALVIGLRDAKPRLERRVLKDERVDIYAGGRSDIEQGRIDVRVLVLILYLAEAHGQVTISSLETGHRLYSRPGVISAHVYGLAVDISGLGDEPIAGNQEPGGLTHVAVRRILRLPAELKPRQVISLLGLGGPSFPLGDHGDHIHVGY